MKILAVQQVTDFFATLSPRFELLLPVLLPDGTRTLGTMEDGPIALAGGPVPGKPTAPFFPQHDPVFSSHHGIPQAPAAPARPLCVIGFTPRDLAALRFIDRFFATGWYDDLYFRRRKNAVVVGVSGFCGPGGTLVAPSGGNCDLELVCDGKEWLVYAYSTAGTALAATLPGGDPERFEEIRRAAAHLPDADETLLKRAAEIVQGELVPDTFWEEIGERCIACTGCNLVCPTCTCFGVQDRLTGENVERTRMWDSCQMDGFMREASGHNPLGSEALRTRRRIHHKLAADPRRWGEISCFLCGRCDATCPTGIGIVAVAREIVARYDGRTEPTFVLTTV
jgi:formate hydrogenlyase subunit 6/NADH:ubiquinone oxidoreductase subunit I